MRHQGRRQALRSGRVGRCRYRGGRQRCGMFWVGRAVGGMLKGMPPAMNDMAAPACCGETYICSFDTSIDSMGIGTLMMTSCLQICASGSQSQPFLSSPGSTSRPPDSTAHISSMRPRKSGTVLWLLESLAMPLIGLLSPKQATTRGHNDFICFQAGGSQISL